MLTRMDGKGKRFGKAFTFKKARNFDPFPKRRKKPVLKKKQIIDNEIRQLEQKIQEGIDESKVETFADFPLSKNTLDGLKNAKYTVPTDIQKQAISLALQGKDVLGAAKTGSGKTLAFLVPIMEVLYRHKTSPAFGLQALIITPTRELAFQIFEVFNKVRGTHDFSANLIIGGKHMWRETDLMGNTNIVICTPGRLLHHLDQTADFIADDLKILVLDEADRIMDSKFAKDMDQIIGHLPAKRQTLLFSATQTKSVKHLARLSLKYPSYISVHEHAEHVTPSGLQQSYMVCELHEKLSLLFNFLKNHHNTKILVFLQTCKQVRYIHAVMKRERPGMTVLALQGGLNQLKRIDIYREFCRKQHAILLATDVACRGLDFPAVNWVVQMDCPIDVDTYIHRAGRTARYQHNGRALLILLPSEEEHMVAALQRRKIPIEKMRMNPNKMRDITGSVSAACVSCQETKDMAERAFRTYVHSVHLMKNKNIFDVRKLDLDLYAKSLGLFITPRLRYLEKYLKKKDKGADEKDVKKQGVNGTDKRGSKTMDIGDESSDSDESDSDDSEESDDSSDSDDSDESEDSDSSDSDKSSDTEEGDLFTVKPSTMDALVVEEDEEEEKENEVEGKKKKLTKAALAKKLLKKGITANSRIVFNEDGSPVIDSYKRRHGSDEEEDDEGGINIQAAAKRLRVEDEVDKKLERERVKQKHREERIKKKERKRAENQQRRAAEPAQEEEAVLSGVDDDDDPFKYIPDPDKLASRDEDQSDEEAREDMNSDSDDDGSGEDSSDQEGSENSDDEDSAEDSSSDDDDVADQAQRRSLEDAAFRLLQKSRLKK